MRIPGWMRVALAGGLVLAAAAVAVAQQVPESMYQEMRWRSIGPFRGGRTRAVAGVHGHPDILYIGVCNGGVWRSNDYGRTWTPIFDSQPTQSIGAIAVSPSDPKVIYVASGEGLQRPDLSVGDGIYKSTDAGKSWMHMPGLRDGQQIPALAVDPRDPSRVFAAVLGHPYGANQERGIFRSTDGGQSWQKVLSKDENTGGSDVEIDPRNPQIIYASLWEARQGPWEDNNAYGGAGGGLFKSTDGGTTWRQLKEGLPQDLVQINLAIAPSEPSRLYATLSTTRPNSYASGRNLGFYRSDDAGEHWYKATDDGRPAMKIGGGDLAIPRVDPQNPDVVYSTSIVTVRSQDGGKTWVSWRGAPGGDDYQNIWIDPEDPKVILLVSDQGAIVSVNGGESWGSWYNQPTAQLYHVQASNSFPYRVCSGQQESGSVCIASRGNDGAITYREWHPVGVIEYGYAAPDPLDPDLVYGAGRSEVSRFRWSTGQVQNVTPVVLRNDKYRFDRTQPIMFSPVDPHVLYFAANVVFKTSDGGQTWQAISPDLAREHSGIPASLGKMAEKDERADKQRGVVYALGPSFHSLSTLWAGTDEGLIWVTRDGGKNWANVTPPELTPWSKVTQIAASHFDDQAAYASVSRLRIDDLRPYVYRTHDGGKTWQKIVSGLPDAPVDTVREDSFRKGLLFAGTENGVWVSFDDGEHWQSLQLNLPHTSMRDLWLHDNDLIVATHGRGFWILDDVTPLRQVKAEAGASFLFRPGAATRVRRSTYTDTPLPPDEPMGENPPDGAVLDYYLAGAAQSVTLEVLDAKGQVVRRYTSSDGPELTEEQLQKQLIPVYWVRDFRALPTGPGMHRWTWDLHYATPASDEHEYPISAVPHDTPREPLGPLAAPGEYTVRLSVDGHSSTAPLTVRMDPRVKTPAAGLTQQFDLATRLASMMTRSTLAVREARSVREQVKKLAPQASGATADALTAFDKKVSAVLQAQPGAGAATPAAPTLSRVNGQTSGLYGAVEQADVAPTVVQVEAMAAVEKDFAAAMKRWEELKATDLVQINAQLREAHLQEIRPEANAEE